MDCCNYSEYRHHHAGGYYGQYPQHPYLGVSAGVGGYASAYYPTNRSSAYPQYADVRSHYNDLQQGFGLSAADHHYASPAASPYAAYQRDYPPAATSYHALRAAYGYGYGYPEAYHHAANGSAYASSAYQPAGALGYAKEGCYDTPPYGTMFGPATDYVYCPKEARARKAMRENKRLKAQQAAAAAAAAKASKVYPDARRTNFAKSPGPQFEIPPAEFDFPAIGNNRPIPSGTPSTATRWHPYDPANHDQGTSANKDNMNNLVQPSGSNIRSSSQTGSSEGAPSKTSQRKSMAAMRKNLREPENPMEDPDDPDDPGADENPPSQDTLPLPGFQQAFGSTEIGRFSESFFTPTTAEPEPAPSSPTMFAYGTDFNDYFDDTSVNLQLEVNATCTMEQSALHHLTDYTTGYQREIKCEDNY